MADLFWFSDERPGRVEPFMLTNQLGVRRENERQKQHRARVALGLPLGHDPE